MSSEENITTTKPFCFESFYDSNDIVELYGVHGSGKSMLAKHLAIQCLLPKEYGGHDMAAIYFDLDTRFNILEFATIMERRTSCSEEEIQTWLNDLYVIRCDNCEKFTITLHSIELLIARSKKKVGLIVIDPISCFHWLESEKVSSGDTYISHNAFQYLRDQTINKAAHKLDFLRRTYDVSVVACCQQLYHVDACRNVTKHNCTKLYRPFLSENWQTIVTKRYVTDVNDNYPGFCAYSVSPHFSKIPFTISDSGLVSILRTNIP